MAQPTQAQHSQVSTTQIVNLGQIGKAAQEKAKEVPHPIESVQNAFKGSVGVVSIRIKKPEDMAALPKKLAFRMFFGQPYVQLSLRRACALDSSNDPYHLQKHLQSRAKSYCESIAQSKKNIAFHLRNKFKAPEGIVEDELQNLIEKLTQIQKKASKEGLYSLAEEARAYEQELRDRLHKLFEIRVASSLSAPSPQKIQAAAILMSLKLA